MDLLHQALKTQIAPTDSHIVIEDFNMHHPQWSGIERNQSNGVDYFLSLLDEHNLRLQLPPGSITYEARGAKSTLDLVFTTPEITDRIITCNTCPLMDHDSDHIPVETRIDLRTADASPTLRKNWEKLDSRIFDAVLTNNLPSLEECQSHDIKQIISQMVETLNKAIAESVPTSQPCERSLPHFTPECKEACQKTNRLRRRWQQSQDEEDYRLYRQACNHKKWIIGKSLTECHRKKVEQASQDPKGLWKLNKWTKTRGNPLSAITPTLVKPDTTAVEEPSDKANLFKEVFFPKPPDADLQDMEGYEYPPDILPFPDFTEREIQKAIKNLSPNKAPGKDAIPNKILQRASQHSQFIPLLTIIFNRSLKEGICHEHFKEAVTVVLRKDHQGTYTVPKAYRPIALLNTLGKAMESVLAKRISYLAQEYHLLPKTHIGGRKITSTEHGIHLTLEKIHNAWVSNQPIVSMLFLDVSGAFDNVSHSRLIHNLRKRGLPMVLINWIKDFLTDRKTSIKLPKYHFPEFKVETGIPQGSPLSPILYLFYNADLIERCNSLELKSTASDWIDDVNIMVTGKSAKANCRTLAKVHDIAMQWASTHASVFNVKKYKLMHFTNNLKKHPTAVTAPLKLGDHQIDPSQSCKLLGLFLDPTLSWDPHIKHVEKKTGERLGALGAIAASSWGLSTIDIRRLYIATILPIILYACSAWYSPGTERGTKMIEQKMIQRMTALQRRGAQVVAGAFRTTGGAELDIELHLLPMK